MKKIMIPLCAAALFAACHDGGDGDASYRLKPVNDVAIYQVNPRVFAPKGSLRAVTLHLDSIDSLGVNVLWMMPVYPIGKEKSKNSPYSISDYTAVNDELGTIDDLKALVDSCHARGISFILDWVANHTSWDNKWLKAHPEWYTMDSAGHIVSPPGTDWTDVADLNYDSPSLRHAMLEAMLFWIREAGVDGFRCDVADMVPADFWKGAIDTLRRAAQPRRLLMLAEGRNKSNFEAGFDMNYAWDFKDSLESVFQRGAPASMLFLVDEAEYDSIESADDAGVSSERKKLRFTTNHDLAKYEGSPITVFQSVEGSMAAWVAAVFLHGGALIYSSQEVAYPDSVDFFTYTSVDWSKGGDIYNAYQRLLTLYNSHPALRGGSITPYPDDDVLAFERAEGSDRLLVLVNVRNRRSTIKVGKDYTLQPYQYLIIPQK